MINNLLFKQLVDLAETVLTFNQPADKILSNFFRNQRNLQSSERFIVAETIYSMLRNYFKLSDAISKQLNSKVTPKLLVVLSLTKLLNLNPIELSNISLDIKLIQSIKLDSSIIELPTFIYDELLLQMSLSEIKDLSESFSKEAPLDLRVNTLKTSREAVISQLIKLNPIPCKYSPFGIRLTDKSFIAKHELFKSGAIEIQDESSQLSGILLNPKRGEWIVDFCAGSGGKTLLIGMLMRNTGRIYAFDNNSKRLGNLAPRLSRSGLSNIHTQLINDEIDSKLKRLHGKIDRVFVDAPCSGTGTIRRNPDIKFRISRQGIYEINNKQLSILTSASKLVKTGGYLLYATCSILRSENQDIVNQFLAQNTSFKVIPADTVLHDTTLKSDDGCLTLLPHIHNTDGFFAALMQRVDV